MKLNKVLLNIASVFCFIFGAFYIFSLVFIPVGVYCFTAGKRFSYKADHLLDNYAVDKKILRNYSIFASIVCFPFGLLALISYFGIYNNNVKIANTDDVKIGSVEEVNDIKNSEVEEMISKEDASVETEKSESIEETETEKLEKLEKLRNFKEKGIITEEEFEMAREQMFGKDTK